MDFSLNFMGKWKNSHNASLVSLANSRGCSHFVLEDGTLWGYNIHAEDFPEFEQWVWNNFDEPELYEAK